MPADNVKDGTEYTLKRLPEHRKPAPQVQLRDLSNKDGKLLSWRMKSQLKQFA